jgi:exonuclease VII small subunit
MRQAVLIIVFFFGLVLLSGCGAGDPLRGSINRIISQMEDGRIKMDNVSADLKKAVDQAKESGKQLKKEDLATARKSMEGLRETGKKLHEYNAEAKQLKDKLKPEHQEELRKEYQSRIQSATDELTKAYDKLKLAFADVSDALGKDTAQRKVFTDLENDYHDAVQEFESIVRQK